MQCLASAWQRPVGNQRLRGGGAGQRGALVEETSGLWFCFVSTRVPGLEENQLCQSSLIVEAIGRT